ncbi:hypothetical protein DX933_01255 [Ornithinibacillus gellani]|uniref:SurA N-terminal domain-containing protein n=1 Tax=Ornithinibacillus gellani TaxID=2293253 RepID=UPI000F471F10|nr:SurA N-terminal domain-containing protein [Ornithinibacillus gellani]TQS76499.1 hypothetical protein DX933_01255 [Ornithinibacillus gellani]
MMKKIMLLMLSIGLAIGLAACSGSDKDKDKDASKDKDEGQEQQEQQELTIGDDEKVAEDDIVAQINDSEVKGLLYNAVYAQTKTQMHQYGQDVSDKDAVKDYALDELIAQELVKQQAAKEGIEVSEKQAKKELDKLKKENEEQLTAYLEEYGLTEDAFQDQLKFGLILEKYMDEKLEYEKVTEKETKEMYDQLKEQNEEIESYDKLKDQIQESLENQKKNESLQAQLEEWKKDAKIEKKI